MKVFVHIPKTAGNFIKNNSKILDMDSTIRHIPEYLSDGETINITKLNICNYRIKNIDAYMFSFVRNPYDRLISAYNYLYSDGFSNKLDIKYGNIIRNYLTFDEFVDDLPKLIKLIVHLVPQHLFICDQNDNICVDFVGKYENLQADITKLVHNETTELIKSIESICLKKINASKKKILLDSISNETKEKIYRVYEKDFIIFGYEK